MDYLWSPWRYKYVQKSDPADRCIFCEKAADSRDEENLIVHRAQHNFVLLNLYPYTSGHLMIAPYQHVATLAGCTAEAALELMQVTRTAQRLLEQIYQSPGFNLGMNMGAAAGAGVAGHIHMHLLPRWVGDSNFMTTIGETRVMPEDLNETYRKLQAAFLGQI